MTRAEYNALVDILNERALLLAQIQQTLDIQFQRIAQMQVQLDEVRAAWGRPLPPKPSA